MRIVRSVIEPGPWWWAILTPLMAEMSTLRPSKAADSAPPAVYSDCPQRSELTVGSSPLRARKAITASVRRSIRPPAMSRRPQP